MKIIIPAAITLLLSCLYSPSIYAAQHDTVFSPANGVLCDQSFCADQDGISDGLTTQYLGQKASDKLASQGVFDRKVFTLSNGVYCDVKEHRCHEDRLVDPKTGVRSRVSLEYTGLLFGGPTVRLYRKKK